MKNNPDIPVALSLGANVGDCVSGMRKAIDALSSFMTVTAVSSVYEADPVYVLDQPIFLNAAITGLTKINPLALMWTIKDIESDLGRGPTYQYGPRVIDIDIIFYGDMIIKTPELIIPHMRMEEREFVLRPLQEIASDWKHPGNGKTVSEMLQDFPDVTLKCLGNILTNDTAKQ